MANALQRLDRAWNAVHKDQDVPYRATGQLPEAFLKALQRFVSHVQDSMNQQPAGVEGPLLQLFFQASQFLRLCEVFDEHFVFDISKRDGPAGAACPPCACATWCRRR